MSATATAPARSKEKKASDSTKKADTKPAASINPLEDIKKHGYIDLDQIHGVDLNKGDYRPHKDYANPKNFYREEVIESLRQAKTPGEIPAIEVWLDESGSLVVIEGDHRVIHAIERFMAGEKAFGRIRADKAPVKSSNEARIRQQVFNIEGRRGSLTEAEEVAAVRTLLMLGQTPEQIRFTLGAGTHSERWMRNVQRVLDANPAVAEAVTSGDIPLSTGDKIAKKVGVKDQPGAVKKIMEAKKSGLNDNKARQEAGLRKGRPTMGKWPQVRQFLASLYEAFKNDELTENQEGQVEAALFIFGVNHLKKAQQIEWFKGHYDEHLASEDRGRKRKGEDA